jgi:hypothetical protein
LVSPGVRESSSTTSPAPFGRLPSNGVRLFVIVEQLIDVEAKLLLDPRNKLGGATVVIEVIDVATAQQCGERGDNVVHFQADLCDSVPIDHEYRLLLVDFQIAIEKYALAGAKRILFELSRDRLRNYERGSLVTPSQGVRDMLCPV